MAKRRHLKILGQGVETWNKWREDNRNVKPDLRGANLKGRELAGADFSDADIRSANFTNAELSGACFQRAVGGLKNQMRALLLIVSW